MNFLYPQFLWALLAIAIPIIIHLFNFKRFKKVYFSDLKLLKEVEMETSKKSNLKHLLILLSRILAIAAIVFAFAQPYFTKNNVDTSQGEKIVSVYLDNSFSMNNVAQEFTLLDKAKEQAENIANLYEQSDKFQLITNDFELKHQRFVTQQEFKDLVQEVSISSVTRKLSQVEQKQLDFLNKEQGQNKFGYYISDFQKSTSDLDDLKQDSTLTTNFVHLTPELTGNVFIDSVWFDSPIRVVNKKESLSAKIVNNSEDDIQVKVELFINGTSEGFMNQDISSNSSSEIKLNFSINSPGIVNAKLLISEYPNPVSTFDDEFYFSYLLDETAKVLVINENSSYLDNKSGNINQLFNNDSYFKLKNSSAGSIDYSEFGTSNVIILNGLNELSSGLVSELMKYTEAGGTIVYFPGNKLNLNSANELLLALEAGLFLNKDTTNTKVNFLDFEHPMFKDVFEKIPKNIDLPVVFNSYKLSVTSRSRVEKLMKLQSGNDFLSKFNYKNGSLYLFTVPLDKDFSNLTRHSVFVTSLLRIVENSGSKQLLSQLISNKTVSLKDENYNQKSLRIKNDNLEIDFIPETQLNRGELKLFLPEEVTQAGNYEIENEDKVVGCFGLNYERLESYFESFTIPEIKSLVGNSNTSVIDASADSVGNSDSAQLYEKETKWWKLFILLALIFVAIEILIIKLMK
ncbi:BatA domain-containing protein [Flavobacteriales bacterium]|nr:BatA domain-containing protein [Flavobacteriales bacterium]